MKRVFCIALGLCLLMSCRSAETGDRQPERIDRPEQSEAPPPVTVLPSATTEPPDGPRPEGTAYNSSFSKLFRRDFIYNPDDGCYYISLLGESYQSVAWAGRDYPWDPPEVERFCKIDAQTHEVTVLSDNRVENLVFSGGYVYFYDPADGGVINRIRGDIIEEVFSLRDHLPDAAAWHYGFFVEGEYLYLLFEWSDISVRVFSLETCLELPSLRYHVSSNAIQIYGGTICSLTGDGLQWKEGAGKLQRYAPAADLIRDFYGTAEFPQIDSFLYDGVLLAQANRDLFLIRPDRDTLELIARDVYGYTLHDAAVYYCAGDTLYAYDIAAKETASIVSFHEDIGGDVDDYYGCENLVGVKFENGRCFLYMTGYRSYSPIRIAHLNLNDGTAVYLTDWFRSRTNRMTSSALGVFSYAYPNDYCVFNDYGSGGGTLIHNYEKRFRIQINSIGYLAGRRAISDTERAAKMETEQGLTLYYSYEEDETPLAALITDGKTYINITVVGDRAAISANEAELFDILKSIRIHPAV